MMHIVFSPESLKDLEQIKDYLLDRFGEKTAGNNLKKVIKEIKRLNHFLSRDPAYGKDME